MRLVGTARAKELILLGDRFGADAAQRLGLVTEVVRRPAGARARAGGAAARLPPLAVSVAKQVIDATPDASRDAGILLERLAYGMLAQTAEHARGAAAFTRKR